MSQFELVIFDCDGVLVDSEHITTRVVYELLAEMGIALSPADLYAALHGRSTAQCLAFLAEQFGGSLPETFLPMLETRAAAALWAEVTPIAGVKEALAQIDISVCVASSGVYEKVQLTLGKVGLLSHFGENIFTVTDVRQPKPAPDIYLLAAQRNGVVPYRCVVIEDSPTGVQAGVAAGMMVFGFAAHTPEQKLREAGAHLIFSDMSQLPDLLLAAAVVEAGGIAY